MPDLKNEIITLKDTIIWLAEERLKAGEAKYLNSAVISITVELDLELAKFMRDNTK